MGWRVPRFTAPVCSLLDRQHSTTIPSRAMRRTARVARRRAAVADAGRAQGVDGLPHVLGARVLAGVGGEAELAEAGDVVGALEQPRRVAALGAGDVEAHDAGAGVEVLGLGQGLAGEDLRDVRAVLAHGDDDEAEAHAVPLGRVVHPRQHGADRLPRCEPGEGVDDGGVAQLEGGHARRRRRVHDGLGDAG